MVLADDTPDVIELLRFAMELDGRFDIVGHAADGREAIAVAHSLQPDAVLLDVAMPVLDGMRAIPEIRKSAPGAKIVILSGLEAASLASEALRQGAHAYLPKETLPDRIAATLWHVCRGEDGSYSLAPTATTSTVQEDPSETSEEELVSILTHELRNQLTVVEGFASTIVHRWDSLPTDAIRDYAGRVARNATLMHTLLDAFSDATRVRSGRIEIDRTPVEVGGYLRMLVEDLATVTKDHVMELDIADDVVAPIDPVRVRQILVNLVSNAQKFSPQGTRICLSLRADADFVSISVNDDGPGIPPDRTGELFRPFSRLGARVPGSGLGLYVSRGIARAHGGDVQLGPSAAGACFVLTLPLS